jgi:probable F420-dependent oxidoreductase
LILPQRQTVLVAKQAAELDLLCGGRLRLGVGVGWNPVEYEALGEDFATRGARLDEQCDLLRQLWTGSSLTFKGRFDQVSGAGLSPLPVQRPIPLWFGGKSTPAYRRMGRLADGWFPLMAPGPDLAAAASAVATAATAAGRDPASIGMEGRLNWHGDPDDLAEQASRWRAAGATHVCLNTMNAGLATPQEHLAALTNAAEVLFGS